MDIVERISRRAAIEQMPRVHFVCGRDWIRGPDAWNVGVFWDRDFEAREWETVYRRCWIVVLRFKLRLLIDKM